MAGPWSASLTSVFICALQGLTSHYITTAPERYEAEAKGKWIMGHSLSLNVVQRKGVEEEDVCGNLLADSLKSRAQCMPDSHASSSRPHSRLIHQSSKHLSSKVDQSRKAVS